MMIKPVQKVPVEVLKLHRVGDTRGLLSRPAYVVGCVWEGQRCKQTVFEGMVFSASTSHPGAVRQLTVGLKEVVPQETFAGAAVLDADGFVIAIATGQNAGGSSEHRTLVSAELLDTISP